MCPCLRIQTPRTGAEVVSAVMRTTRISLVECSVFRKQQPKDVNEGFCFSKQPKGNLTLQETPVPVPSHCQVQKVKQAAKTRLFQPLQSYCLRDHRIHGIQYCESHVRQGIIIFPVCVYFWKDQCAMMFWF